MLDKSFASFEQNIYLNVWIVTGKDYQSPPNRGAPLLQDPRYSSGPTPYGNEQGFGMWNLCVCACVVLILSVHHIEHLMTYLWCQHWYPISEVLMVKLFLIDKRSRRATLLYCDSFSLGFNLIVSCINL